MPLIDDQFDDLGEWRAFRDLFQGKRSPRNPSQEALLQAWDAIQLVHGNGVEALLEQSVPLATYAAALAEVGMLKTVPVLMRVQQRIAGSAPGDGDASWSFVREHFDSLKRLAEEFWDTSVNSDEVLMQYVKDHGSEFAEYLPRR